MSTQLDPDREEGKVESEATLHVASASAHAGVPHGNLEADESAGCERG
jgi:hypothetical protein